MEAMSSVLCQAQLEDVEGSCRMLMKRKARTVSLELNGAREKKTANQTVAAIAARYTLVEQGQLLMNAATEAQLRRRAGGSCLKPFLKGDDLARQAAQLVTETTAENVEASKNKTERKRWLPSMRLGIRLFRTFNRRMRRLISRSTSIILAKRQESLGYAIASDDAILAKNKEEATAQNNAYNIARCPGGIACKSLRRSCDSSSNETFAKPRRDVQRPIQQHVYKRAAQTLY